MKDFASAREKWELYLSGEDVGPVVSPLCDDWSLDLPYAWPYEGPDPFPQGHRAHTVSQQMAMAKICGWDPTYLCSVDFVPQNQDIISKHYSYPINGGIRTETLIKTPYGDLTSIMEQKESMHIVKQFITSKDDYKKVIWFTKQLIDYNEDIAIAQGTEIRSGIGDKGILGTWLDSPFINMEEREELFYHLADWPELVEELFEVSCELKMKRIETYRKAGFDYIFYCVDGTEISSPGFFRKWTLDDTKKVFKKWREMGGFVIWHTCGHIKKFIEEGFYNELMPDIFETLSEPPVGNLPSLRWARERIDRKIITKGNMPLNILLEGTEEDIRRDVGRIREETKGYRHIIGLSDDMLHNTPLVNALIFVDEARKTC